MENEHNIQNINSNALKYIENHFLDCPTFWEILHHYFAYKLMADFRGIQTFYDKIFHICQNVKD